MSFASWRRWLRRRFAPRANTTIHKPSRARLAVEKLEERLAPAILFFENDEFNGLGDWGFVDPMTSGTNWTGDVLPGPGDTAVFDAGALQVNVDGSYTVQDLLFTNSTGQWILKDLNPGNSITILSTLGQNGLAGSTAANRIDAPLLFGGVGITANIVNGSLELTNAGNTFNGSIAVQSTGNLIARGDVLAGNLFGQPSITLNGGTLTLDNADMGNNVQVNADSSIVLTGVGTAPLPGGYAAYYSFDAGTVVGTTVSNLGSLGASKDGTLTGGATVVAGGISGDAMSIADNSNQVMNINLSGAPAKGIDLAGGNWTASAWFNGLHPTDTWRTLFRGNTNDHQVIVEAGSQRLGMYDNATGGAFRPSGFNMGGVVSGWHLVTAVGSGPTTTFYIDGAFVGTSDRGSVADIYAVGNIQGGGQPFAQLIDEVKIWQTALSVGQATGKNASLGNLTFSAPGLTLNVAGPGAADQDLTFVGTTLLNQSTVQVGGSTIVNLQGLVDGAPPGTGTMLTKTGVGTLHLSNSTNIYTGQTVINGGTVAVSANNALGFTGPGNETVVNAGGQLDFRSVIYTTQEEVAITGTGPGNTGAIHSTGGAFWGPITATNGTNSIVTDIGTFDIRGGILTQGGELQFGGTGTTVLHGVANAAGPDEVWLDDATPVSPLLNNFTATNPAGGITYVNSMPAPGPAAPASGSLFHPEPVLAGQHNHSWNDSSGGNYHPVFSGDTFFTETFLTPGAMPTELLLGWFDSTAGPNWRVGYWGPDLWALGASRAQMSATLPPSGSWERLDVPATTIGFNGTTAYARGAIYAMQDGGAAFDRTGIRRGVAIMETAPTAVRKIGTGTLRVLGANLYSGDTNIDAGVLDLRNTFGLGSSTSPSGLLNVGVGVGATNVAAGAQLFLGDHSATPGTNGGNVNIPAGETLNIAGNGLPGNVGAIRTGHWQNTIYAPINLTGNATINNWAGNGGMYRLNLAGNVNMGAFNLHLVANNSYQWANSGTYVDGQITGSGSITIGRDLAGGLWAGRIYLTNPTNSYTGLTTVIRGDLVVTADGALGSTAAGTVVQSQGTLSLDGGFTYSIQEALTLAGPGEPAFQNATWNSSIVGALRNLSGDNTWGAPITLTDPTTNSIGVDSGTLTITSVIGQSGGNRSLQKTGPGELILTNVNTYAGLTNILMGTLTVTVSGALGTATGPTQVLSGATLRLQGVNYALTEQLILNGGGQDANGALQSVGNSSWAGSITTNSPSSISSNNAGTTLTLDSIQSDYAFGFRGAGDIVVNGNIDGVIGVAGVTPGLVEGRLTGGSWFNLTTANPGNLGIQLTPRAGNVQNAAPWVGNGDVIIYNGWFYDADGFFSFAESVDDGTFVVIDGRPRLYSTSANTPTTTGSISNNQVAAGQFLGQPQWGGEYLRGANVTTDYGMGPAGDGWHEVEFRFGNNTGTRGATNAGGLGWSPTFGFGYSASGSTSNAAASYIIPVDPGDGSLFRTTGPVSEMHKYGAGTLTFNGASNYLAPTFVHQGTLIVNGSIVSDVTVQSGATVGGDGTTGAVTAEAGSTVLPGMATFDDLETDDLTLEPGSTISFQLGGLTPGSQHDQLIVNGSVTLAGANFLLSEVAFSPALGDQFTIIDNDGNLDSVVGTFANLPNLGTVYGSSFVYQIDYFGGDGNDVVLTVIKGIFVSPSVGLVTTEAGGTDTFDVFLTHAPNPGEIITVDLHSGDLSEGEIIVGGVPVLNNTLRLTFTDSTWNIPQTVTIRGVDDSVPDGDRPYTIVTDPAVSTDLGSPYHLQDPPDVFVTNLDEQSDLQTPMVKLVQRFTTSLGAFSSTTVNLPTPVDPSKTFVLGSQRTNNPSAWNRVTFELTPDGSAVIVTKGGGTNTTFVEFQVVEFWSGVRVWRGREDFAAADVTRTVNLPQPVAAGKAFALVSERIATSNTLYDERWNTMAQIVGGGSQLELSRGEAGDTTLLSSNPPTPYSVAWQVIEFTDGGTTVDSGTTTIPAGLNFSIITGPEINDTPNSADFLFFTSRYLDNDMTVQSGNEGQYLVRGGINSTTNVSRIDFLRSQNLNEVEISWFLIHMPQATATSTLPSAPHTLAGGFGGSAAGGFGVPVATFGQLNEARSISWATNQINVSATDRLDDGSLTNRLATQIQAQGSYALGANTITGLSSTAGLTVGMVVLSEQAGIPFGTTITGIAGSTLTISNNTTAAAGPVNLAFGLPLTVQGSYTAGSNQVTGLSSTVGLAVGMLLSSDQLGIPPNARITAINGSTLTLSVSATASSAGAANVSVPKITNLQMIRANTSNVVQAQWFVLGFADPLVSFETTSSVVNESSGIIQIPITLHTPISQDVTLNFSVGGTADPAQVPIADYSMGTVSPVTFTAGGSLTQYITITINADGVPAGIEGNETIVLTLTSAINAAIWAPAGVHTITIMNGPPVAEDDIYTVNEGPGVIIDNTATPAQGVIQNVNPNGADSDPDNDPLTISDPGPFPISISTSAGGTVLLNANGTFQYTAPNADWFGTDTFTYQATDGAAVSNTATVFINVLNVNDPPQNLYNGAPAPFPAPPGLATDEFTPLVLTGSTGLSIADVDSTYNAALVYTVRLQSTLGTSSVTLAGGTSIIVGGNGSSDFTMQGTLADLNATLNAVTFTPSGPGAGGVTITTNDGIAPADTDTVPIDIADINNPPVPDSETLLVNEGSTGADPANQIDDATMLAGDTDGGDGPGPLSIVSVSASSAAGGTVTYAGGVAAYTPPNPDFTGPDSFTYVVTDDGGTTTAVGTVNINFTATNDAPVNLWNGGSAFPGGPVNTPEDTALVFDAGNIRLIQVSDIDAGGGLVFVSLTSAGGTIDVQGDLVGLTVTANGSSSVTLEGTLTDLNEALSIIVFNPTPDLSGGGFLSISTNDQGNTGAGGPQVDSDIVPINIVAVNDRPVADLNGGSAGNNYTATFTEGGGPVAIVDNLGLTVSDVDNGTLSSATVSFVPPDGGFEVLSVTTVPGITVNYAGGVLTLTGPDTLANFQQVLRTLQYNNTSGAPSTTPRTINVVVDDGTGGATATNSPVAQITVNIVAQNTAPENRMQGAALPGPGQTVAENTTAAPSQLIFSNGNGNQLSVFDPDAAAGTIFVRLSVTNGILTVGGFIGGGLVVTGDGTNQVDFTGTAAEINTAISVMSYTPTLNYNGPALLTFFSDDQGNTGLPGALNDTDTIAITVTPVNSAPVVGTVTLTTPDNVPVSVDLDPLISDVETPDGLLVISNLAVSVPGSGSVSIVGHVVTFTPAIGFGGTTGFTFDVTDQGDNGAPAQTTSGSVTVIVATFSTPATNITLSPSSVRERAAAGTVVGTLATVDPDPGDQHTYTLLSNPGGAFRLVNSAGVWRVVVNNPAYLDFEARRTITIRVQTRDLGGSTFAKNLVISLINVYERPIARDDVYTTTMNTPLSLTAARGVLRNDFKDASRTLRVTLVRGPRRGTLRLNRNGSFTYTPRLRFFGQDTFVYRISDGTNVDTAVVTINVRPRPLSGGRLT